MCFLKYSVNIIIKLKKGEKSNKIENFDRNKNLELLKANFLKKDVL